MAGNRHQRRAAAKTGKNGGGPTLPTAEALQAAGRFGEAAALYQARLAGNAGDAAAWYGQGLCLGRLGRLQDGMAALACAIALAPDQAHPWVERGDLAFAADERDAAVRHFGRTAYLAPGNPYILRRLGNALLEVGAPADAAPILAAAASGLPDGAPERADVQIEFASAMIRLGKVEIGFGLMRAVFDQVQDKTGAWTVIGMAHAGQGRVDIGTAALRNAAILTPGSAKVWRNLGGAFSDQGRLDLAVTQWRRAAAISPNPGLSMRIAMALDPIEASNDSIDQRRLRLEADLDRLAAAGETIPDPHRQIGVTPFYLAYHGRNDRILLAKLADTLRACAPSLRYVAPHVAGFRPRARPRIVVVSRHLRNHTVGALLDGFFRHRDRDRFELIAAHVAASGDVETHDFDQLADGHFVLPENLAAARAAVAQLAPDIVFYPEIGMDGLTWYMAFARLAPLQVTSWGHPDTTGLPTIDRFITSALIEPADWADHYGEGAILLPTLPGIIPLPEAPPATARADFGLPDDRRLYICAQSLFKLHPDFDAGLAEILRRDADALIVLIAGMAGHWGAMVSARLRESLGDDFARVRFVDRLSPANYLALLTHADVLIDPPHFSGGKTSLEAFALGQPIVTWDAPFMRGRVTIGCYRAMGMTGLVARTPEEFAQLAVDTARDGLEIKGWIAERKALLFDPVPGVRAMEDALAAALAEVCA